MSNPRITVEAIKEAFAYNPDTGEVVWKNTDSFKRINGKIAGCLDVYGYQAIGFKKTRIGAHRVAWAIHYGYLPKCGIDHINGDPRNNRIVNLRLANQSQNIANAPVRKTNKCGMKGVHLHKETGLWRSRICVNYKYISLGLHKRKEDAHEAYMQAAKKYFGEYACANERNMK